ncbi:protein AGENET DOMAIN (AGD)-CONTAINING P1 [Lathyrus oleraceus]|uniref:Agenet domain-containing protein n=1 Tax=Pisum sativum TaxID=3888 RepID=A0A9D5A7U1_PEA|nr:protein AGENET DOMAIN (AGD)-CONTAINING P1-like [Pisum sativum]KAI5398679.1 hypothetical protein KIW84_064159 [Pisum sativum]
MASSSKTRSSSPASSIFKPGTLVEISSDDDGFRGSWFTGKIVRRLVGDKFMVEYDNLMADEDDTKRLKEPIRLRQLRPIPPKEITRDFKFGDEVDAYHNDGWWEGHVTGILEDGRKTVYFRVSREQLEFPNEELRLHREWVNGGWIPPFSQQDDSEIKKKVCVKAAETVTLASDDFKFKEGDLVEVCSDEDGFKGAWFSATLIEAKAGWKFVVEYESLLDDDSKLLREEVSILQIRPRPPKTDDVDQFKFLDEVDTYYNDGWWVGIVSKVLGDSKYIVYFRNSNEELKFEHSQLRLHQDWVDNKWVMASKALKF